MGPQYVVIFHKNTTFICLFRLLVVQLGDLADLSPRRDIANLNNGGYVDRTYLTGGTINELRRMREEMYAVLGMFINCSANDELMSRFPSRITFVEQQRSRYRDAGTVA